jgi:ElaB/YqjD/DUF883 family membrane-anchored ribosome-binding protein
MTTNRGSRQSEYQRSIAGAGNVRPGGEERYGGGSSRYSEGSRGYGQDEFSRTGSRLEEGMDRVSERLSDTYGQVADQFGETYGDLRDQGRRALRTTGERVRSSARAAQDYFEANPLMIGVVGLAAGLLLGALFPLSRRERQIFEPIGENLRETAVRQSAEVMRQVARGAEDLVE